MKLTLKLLNGPMQGRSLRLPEGGITIGLGDTDLQLPLEGEFSRVTLRVTAEACVQLLEPAPCWVEGRKLQDRRLPPGKIIDLAGVAFVLLTEGETFTSRRIPERLVPGRWQFTRMQRRIATGVGLVLLMLASGIAFYYWQHQESEAEKVSRLGVQRWLVEQHRRDDLKRLGFEWLQDGTLRVYGQCPRQQVLTEVLQQLRIAGVFWRLETQCQDQLLDEIRQLLEQSGYRDVEVIDGRYPGEARICGDIQADARWQKVVKQLAEMEGLKRWDVSGRSATQGRGLLEAVRKAGALGQISLEKQGHRLIISGLLSAEQHTKLADALRPFRLETIFQQIPPRGTADSTLFPQPVVSIGGNRRNAWLVLADGRRLQVGTTLNNEYEIVHIDPASGIDLFRRGSLLHLPMTF
ncbi:type III secretion system inner membrane ring subunit SctD [Enterobacteriaceae bacterium H20N1]|uniref:Type III secretion system inner membrane ring subunit SctD n=1 Tax=Dryocola boscaweniae TaxID=2925397 RepID=A0A9X3ALX8_9ENTR|nr:type III secretion system inner membrane ring subunit SctD [Dryocola boscaweniae]MCT4700507.1 type III secretion system inner membrane ring subunit SctD [Dryocola boscaweniae]MCT4717663.1 type III secretion system inner membrane ring subunit SctD [Dryocola boscaweniae]